MMNLPLIHAYLERENAAYVSFDYENKNPFLADLTDGLMLTRKIAFVFYPKGGRIIAQSLDVPFLRSSPKFKDYEIVEYSSWKDYLTLLGESVIPFDRLIVDYSKNGLLPRTSLADYGSVEFLTKLGKKIVSSADLLNMMIGTLTNEQIESQIKAAKLLLQIKDEAFALIRMDLKADEKTDELRVQNYIAKRFDEEGLVYDDKPIVAVNANASNPHYAPSKDEHSPIVPGDLILIDMWAKFNKPHSVYADITWMAYAGKEVPDNIAKPFHALKTSIDMALAYLEKKLPEGRVEGWEVDFLVRKAIEQDGYGDYFIHRTGHSIKDDEGPHGPGVNIDDFETHDTRAILNGNSFSLEPGIYLPEFGLRSETDVVIVDRKPVVIAGRQKAIIPLL